MREATLIAAIHARECGCEWGADNHEQEERRSWRAFAADAMNLEQSRLRDEFERLNGPGSSMEPL